MSTVQPIDNNSTYDAVKIRINRPKADIFGDINNKGNFHAIDIEVDEPQITVDSTYNYPTANTLVTSEYVINPIDVQKVTNLPAYQAVDINNEPEMVEVPEPNYTTVEEEKIPFTEEIEENEEIVDTEENEKIATDEVIVEEPAVNKKKEIEIIPSEEILPDVNIHEVLKNLASENYDIQAEELEKITKAYLEDENKALSYVTKDVFHSLINIVENDTSSLEGPSKEQIEIREKIIMNEIARENAIKNNEDMSEFKAPYEISDSEIVLASELTPLEKAERNKEFALYTIALLSKVYVNEYQKQTGNIVPFTDLPGISNIVDTLRHDSNPGLKIAAINSIPVIYREEYKDELNSILVLAAKDENPLVANRASDAFFYINNK